MFRQVDCTEELVRHFGRANHTFSQAVKVELQKRTPATKFTLYSYTTDDAVYWYGSKVHKFVKSNSILCSEGVFHKDHFIEGFRLFDKVIGITGPRKPYMLVADELYIDTILKVLEEADCGWEKFPTVHYFIGQKQEEFVLTAKIPELPEGYELGSSTAADAEVITKHWIHAGPGDEEQTRMKVTSFPSSCIRYHGEPVAFIMCDVGGNFNHQFVLPGHRRKGLGNVLELDLAQKCIREGIIVYKNVETFNTPVLEASNRSKFWSKVTDEKGVPVIRLYLDVWPNEDKIE